MFHFYNEHGVDSTLSWYAFTLLKGVPLVGAMDCGGESMSLICFLLMTLSASRRLPYIPGMSFAKDIEGDMYI